MSLDYASINSRALNLLLSIDKHTVSIAPQLKALLELRVSQINGCAFCVDLHSNEARGAGETQQRLDCLPVWRESQFFSEKEMAALDCAESVTLISSSTDVDKKLEQLLTQFSEAEAVDLTFVVAVMNSLNRLGSVAMINRQSGKPSNCDVANADHLTPLSSTQTLPVFLVTSTVLPENALSRRYLGTGAYTDCYETTLSGRIGHEQFIEAFYTTWIFKLERLILRWIASRPSTDIQAQQLADGSISDFAAWTVEDRCKNQLLMCDLHGRTRSWLMVDHVQADKPTTRLLFGSVVTAVINPKSGRPELGFWFSALLGFHKLYSRFLLRAARNRLVQQATT